jgi:hypothetical protein
MPAAWTIDVSQPGRGWKAVEPVSSALMGVTVLGPGRLANTVAATSQDGDSDIMTLSITNGLQVIDQVPVSGPCFAVDHTGTNFLCSTRKGMTSESFNHPRPHVIDPADPGSYTLSWW